MAIDRKQIDKWFDSNRLPRCPDAQDAAIQEIRIQAKRLAEVIVQNTPASSDQSVAIRHVREALTFAAQSCLG